MIIICLLLLFLINYLIIKTVLLLRGVKRVMNELQSIFVYQFVMHDIIHVGSLEQKFEDKIEFRSESS